MVVKLEAVKMAHRRHFLLHHQSPIIQDIIQHMCRENSPQ